MKSRLVRLAAFLLVGGMVSVARAGDVTLEPGGAPSLQAAVDAIPQDNGSWVRIRLKPGTYSQQLNVTRPHVALVGLGASSSDVKVTFNLAANGKKVDGSGNVGTTGSSSTYVKAPDFFATNVTFANDTPDNVAQAVAIKTVADRCIFYKCRFEGFQDTLYPTSGRCYFKDCFVTGDTDFIFGNATAVFDGCTVNSSDAGYVTAANTKPETKYGFVFLDCTLTASPGVRAGSTALGRPWQWDRGSSAAVTYVRCKLGPHVAAGGWNPWDKKNTDPAAQSRYAEYGSTDLEGKPLDVSNRVKWAKQLSADAAAAYTVGNVLGGDDHWDPQGVIKTLASEGSK